MQFTSDKEHLVLENRNLIHNVLKIIGISKTYYEYDDLVSVGEIGLIKAAISFDAEKGVLFSTYASDCIKNELFMYFRKNAKHNKNFSFNTFISPTFKGENIESEVEFIEFIEDPSNFLEKTITEDSLCQVINRILNCLNPKDRIINLYRLAGCTQNEIAKILNVSQSHVSRCLSKTREKLQRYISQPIVDSKFLHSMKIQGSMYLFSISSKNLSKAKKLFALISEKLKKQKSFQNFKICYNYTTISLLLPSIKTSFYFLAKIIQTMEKNDVLLTLSDISQKTSLDKENEEKHEKSSKHVAYTPIPEHTKQEYVTKSCSPYNKQLKEVYNYILGLTHFTFKDIQNTFPSLPSEFLSNFLYRLKSKGIILKIENVYFLSSYAESTKNFAEKAQTIIYNGKSPKPNPSVLKRNLLKQLHDYVLTQRYYTISDILMSFPDLSSKTISNFMSRLKKKGIIISTGRGKYFVKPN